ncbi:gamma-glutamylcyclotransferase family protein [Phytohalomonas tamaricis]|uniref:gamma-glutamylcyclotransferase family protein n=1 Tax=Phytohalomonas tamaricis TaxID=2081032 RepID=UPI000D0BE513|nr:gamma-glutamylcyclotransferase family protein [Phytohalomonas tamaricis]
MGYYFAYGSNMNEARMQARVGGTRRALAGRLEHWELTFDKASRVAGLSHANVRPAAGHHVEGVLYELVEDAQISLMDPFEGYPVEYDRQLMVIESREGPIEAWVYIASAARTGERLRPAQEYMHHLLAGRAFLSESYHAKLQAQPSVEALSDETLSMLGLTRLA